MKYYLFSSDDGTMEEFECKESLIEGVERHINYGSTLDDLTVIHGLEKTITVTKTIKLGIDAS